MAIVEQSLRSPHVSVKVQGWADIAARLEKLPIELRGIELEKAIRKPLNKIKQRARELVSPPGYPGDKPGLRPLRDTISVTLKRYKGGAVIAGLVGPEYPAGAHGHLVEHGHRIARGGTLSPLKDAKRKTAPASKQTGRRAEGAVAGHVPPYPFVGPAAEEIAPTVETEIINALNKSVDKALRG